MRLAASVGLALAAGISVCSLARAESSDDSLKVYAVNVIKQTPFEKPFTGYGIYLGRGVVITAAHVIGRWGFLKNPRVFIAGQELPVKILKEGSIDDVDLTLLSVDEAKLPVSLRLRQNRVCKRPPRPGQSVIAVTPEGTKRSHVISPLHIAPELRRRFNTLISEVAKQSGSGIFDADSRCLLGIMSRSITKYDYRMEAGRLIAEPTGHAGYFVPASVIEKFMPAELRF